MPASRSAAPVLLGFLLFGSGAVALIYEVLWQREFALLFGSGASATAVVLAAYFLGLGVGGVVFGKWGSRWGAPLSLYAALECAIAIGALLVTPVLSLYESWYPAIVSQFGDKAAALLLLKGLLATAAILVPTAAMGGTLPVLAELVDAGKGRLGLSVGWFYLVNTAGAALGAISVPLVLLPTLGARRAVFACAAVNGLIALTAFLMRSRWPADAVPPNTKPAHAAGHSPLRTRLWLLLAFISGGGMFALQVLWNRAFAQVHENSIYAFAIIVTVFLLAIALGAQVARWFLTRGIRIERALGGAWMIGGLAVGFCPMAFIKLTDGLSYLPAASDWTKYAVSLLLLSGGLIFLPVATLAAGLPLLLEQLGSVRKQCAGDVTGKILAVNIAGSILGALLAGFALPTWLGLWRAMIAIGSVFAGLGVWVLCRSTAARVPATMGVIFVTWMQATADLPKTHLDVKHGERLLAVREGAHGIAAVTERAGSRRLKLNNHYTLGGTFATGDERMQAHIPLLVHPQPRRTVFLGLGTGITASGALFHPGLKVEAVELVPEVVQLAATWFGTANENFCTHPDTRLIIDDARNFLRGSRVNFDVIVTDIVVPWQQGEAALYTKEHFEAAKRDLNTNGVFCAWVPAFQLGEKEFQILLRTFVSVFGSAQIWRGDFSPDRPAIALIALNGELNAAVVQRRLSEMRPDPSNPHLQDARAFWMYFVGIVRAEDTNETRVNREDRPWLELLAPLHRRDDEFITGRKLIDWQLNFSKQAERLTHELSPEAASGYQAGQLMAEFTLAVFQDNRQRAAEMQARIRELVGERTFGILFGVP
jgi:spermidine synthase